VPTLSEVGGAKVAFLSLLRVPIGNLCGRGFSHDISCAGQSAFGR